MASVLHVFDILPALSSDGSPIKASTEIPLDIGVAYVVHWFLTYNVL